MQDKNLKMQAYRSHKHLRRERQKNYLIQRKLEFKMEIARKMERTYKSYKTRTRSKILVHLLMIIDTRHN